MSNAHWSHILTPLKWLVRRASAAGAILAFGLLGGCASLSSNESALNPAGPQAQRLASLFWMFLAVCVVVWVLVITVLTSALLGARNPTATPTAPELTPEPAREKRIWITVSSCVLLTTITLFFLLIGEFSTARASHRFGENVQNQVAIQIKAQQWWWQVNYKDATASDWITTANEIVIPVGRKVAIEVASSDVIHSFWVPNLGGKKDVVPGHPSILWLQADKPGVYWGECAEYCGLQHAQMRLVVKAVSQNEFDRWLANGRSPAREPQTDLEKRGKAVFLASTCISCHQINGTMAFGQVGPNLTHVGGRLIIAAGALPNTEGNMAGWIADPQRVKPGSRMPQTLLSPEDLRAVTDYLQSLK